MASSKNVLKEILPEVLAARDLLERDEEARRIDREKAAYADALRKQLKDPPELRRPLRAEPVEIKEKNVVTDPNSWLNRGLRNLAGNAASVILGEPSGNNLVDLGAANVPGVGAGAILAAGGMPGIVDVVPGVTGAKNVARGAVKNVPQLLENISELGRRWVLAKTEARENPLDWFKMPRRERNEWMRLNGLDPNNPGVVKAMDRNVTFNYNILQADRIEDLLGRDIAELAPTKKAYTAPYSAVIEPPGGASRILTGPVPEEPVEEAANVLINPAANETVLREATGATPDFHSKEYRRIKSAERRESQRAYMEKMDQEELAKIRADAIKAGEAKRQALVDAGVTDKQKLKNANNSGIKSYIDKTIGNMMKAEKESARTFMDSNIPYTQIPEEYRKQASENAKAAAREAWERTPGDFRAKQEAYEKAYQNTRGNELRRLYPEMLRRRDKATSNNLRYAFNTFDDETQNAIRKLAQEAANAAGRSGTSAYSTKYSTTLNSLIRDEVKRRGYKSVNDPALQHADWFGGENPGVTRKIQEQASQEPVVYRNSPVEEVEEAADDIVRYSPEEIAELDRQFAEEFARLEAEEAARAAAAAVPEAAKEVAQEAPRLSKKERKQLRKAAEARNRAEQEAAAARRDLASREAMMAGREKYGPEAVLNAGWRPAENRPLSGYPYPRELADDVEKRNYFFADSVAGRILSSLDYVNPVTGERLEQVATRTANPNDHRHAGTNYEQLWRKFSKKLQDTFNEGRNTLDLEYGESVGIGGRNWYDELFRRKVDDAVRDRLRRR